MKTQGENSSQLKQIMLVLRWIGARAQRVAQIRRKAFGSAATRRRSKGQHPPPHALQGEQSEGRSPGDDANGGDDHEPQAANGPGQHRQRQRNHDQVRVHLIWSRQTTRTNQRVLDGLVWSVSVQPLRRTVLGGTTRRMLHDT
jgi:hypothetical protein